MHFQTPEYSKKLFSNQKEGTHFTGDIVDAWIARARETGTGRAPGQVLIEAICQLIGQEMSVAEKSGAHVVVAGDLTREVLDENQLSFPPAKYAVGLFLLAPLLSTLAMANSPNREEVKRQELTPRKKGRSGFVSPSLFVQQPPFDSSEWLSRLLWQLNQCYSPFLVLAPMLSRRISGDNVHQLPLPARKAVWSSVELSSLRTRGSKP